MKKNIILLFSLLLLLIFTGCETEDLLIEVSYNDLILSSETDFDFSSVGTGKNSLVLSLRNPLEKSYLIIDSISIDSSEFKVQSIKNTDFIFPMEIAPQGRIGMWLQYLPTAEGEHKATLTVKTRLQEGEVIDFLFPVQSEIFSVGIGNNGTGLVFEHDAKGVSFGAVDIGTQKEGSIRIRNISTQSITIQDALVAAPFSFLNLEFPFTFAPNETKRFDLVFSPIAVGDKEGLYFSSAFLLTDSGANLEIPLDGFAKELSGAVLKIETSAGTSIDSSYSFSDVGLGQKGDVSSFILKNAGTQELVISDLALSNIRDFTFSELVSFPRTILPKSSLEIGIQFTPAATSLGISASELQITSNSSGSPLTILRLTGEALGANTPRLSLSNGGEQVISDSIFRIPSAYINETMTTEFLLKNIGTAELNVNSLAVLSESAFFSVVNEDNSLLELPFSVSSGDQVAIKLLFSSDSLGSYNSTLEIQTNDKEYQSFSVEIQASSVETKLLLPPTLEFVNEGAVRDSFVGDYTIVGNPQFLFRTALGSGGNSEFRYSLEKDGITIEENNVSGENEIELSPGVELNSGVYSLSVVESNDDGISSEPLLYSFIISRSNPQPPVVEFSPRTGINYLAKEDVVWTTDITPVFTWRPAEGEENSVASYKFSISNLDTGSAIQAETATRNKIFTLSKNHIFSEGNYLFQIIAIDGFGQESLPSHFKFSLDLTPPVITLTNVAGAEGSAIVLPKGIFEEDIVIYDPIGSATDAIFGECEIEADYSGVFLALAGSYNAYYVAEDPLGNKRVESARTTREISVIDFDALRIDFKQNLVHDEGFSINIEGAPAKTYGQLTYEYNFAAGLN